MNMRNKNLTGQSYYDSFWETDITLMSNIARIFNAQITLESTVHPLTGFLNLDAKKRNTEVCSLMSDIKILLQDTNPTMRGFFSDLCDIYAKRTTLLNPDNEAIKRIGYVMAKMEAFDPDLTQYRGQLELATASDLTLPRP